MKILINGIAGRMGGEVAKLALSDKNDVELTAGVDVGGNFDGVHCYKNFDSIEEDIDCVIDFSHHSAVEALLIFCVKNKKPVVIATTGHTEEELEMIRDASKHIPVFFSMNMSVGVALLCELAKITVKTFPDADIEIVETHHNRKLDSPSGTAILIANAVKSVRNGLRCVMGRNGKDGRAKDEIGIHSVRVGNIVGEHCVIVGTDSQTITLKHEAHERSLFAEGAISAAKFIADKENGLYDMNDMIR